jgi:6-phosphogluconolactonase (cycloisomerase 2 family)
MDTPQHHGQVPAGHLARRDLIVAAGGLTGVALLGTLTACAQNPATASPTRGSVMYAYVGSRTTQERNARGDGISVYRVNAETGALDPVQVLGDLVNPSYLAIAPGGRHLYTVHGDESEVSSFAIDRDTGKIRFLNRQSTQGKNPVHLAFDPSGRFLIVSNHIGASLAVLPVAGDGSLQPLTQLVPLSGPIGPHRIEQKQSKPHFNPFDTSGRFVIVPDKGLDRVFSFRFEGGQLLPAAAPFVATREGAGPRHLVFHPNRALAYAVNELDSTVTTYRYRPETGALEPLQVLSSLPSTFPGNSRAAGIAIDGASRTLYASNRGHDSIAVFRIAETDGLLSFTGTDPSLGRTPRFVTLSPDGRLLYALNEDSDSIVALRADRVSGRLTPTGQSVQAGSPVCMVFST